MATFKAVVMKHHRKKDGSYNIKIRVTQNRVKRYIATPYFCTSADLTRSLSIKNARYLDLCRDIIDDFKSRLDPFGMAVLNMSADKVVEICTSKKEESIMFTDILSEYSVTKGIEPNTIKVFKSCLYSLKKYLHCDDVDLLRLNSTIIQSWISSISPSTAHSYSIKLSSLYNYIIKTRNDFENNITVIKGNPFDKVIIPAKNTPEKKAISVEELRKIIAYNSNGNDTDEFAKNMFLLSFYLVGTNLIDIYNMSKKQLLSEYIEYERQKTKKRRTDSAFIRIKVQPEARELVEKVYDKLHKYSENSVRGNINRHLKKIADELGISNLVLYTARHTWATLAVNDCNIDKYTVHIALNHVDSKTAITDVYIKKDFSVIDKANRKVIDYVLNK